MPKDIKSKTAILRFSMGVKGCYYAYGKPCRFVRVRRLGTEYVCALYDKELLTSGPHKTGYLQRCEPCKEEFDE